MVHGDIHTDHTLRGSRYGTVRYGTARYDTARYGMVRHGTVHYGTVRYGTARHGTLRYGTVRYGTRRGRTVPRTVNRDGDSSVGPTGPDRGNDSV